MGVGHLGASFALRARFPRVPLFYLLLAAVLVDVLWGIAVLVGLETAYIGPNRGAVTPLVLASVPYTHSLVACALWGALVAGTWWRFRRDGGGALVLGALVVSHWVLDVVSHLADVPLLPAGPLLGLGLWRSPVASVVVELGMLLGGIAVYARRTEARDRIGSIGLVAYSLVVALLGLGGLLGPPPRTVIPIAAGQLLLILPLLCMQWVDAHRGTRQAMREEHPKNGTRRIQAVLSRCRASRVSP